MVLLEGGEIMSEEKKKKKKGSKVISPLMKGYKRLLVKTASAYEEIIKTESGVQKSRVRLRKIMQDIKEMSQSIRDESQTYQ